MFGARHMVTRRDLTSGYVDVSGMFPNGGSKPETTHQAPLVGVAAREESPDEVRAHALGPAPHGRDIPLPRGLRRPPRHATTTGRATCPRRGPDAAARSHLA